MKIISMLLTGVLFVTALGTPGTAEHQPSTEQVISQTHSINYMKANEIALNTSKGGLVTKTEAIESNGIKAYEVSIINEDNHFEVQIDASTGKVLSVDSNKQSSTTYGQI
jgi:uncharacterized membrane protein YkoI